MTNNGDETVLAAVLHVAAALQRMTEVLERKCPEVESSQYLCDRPARYEVRGGLVCEIHARRQAEAEQV